MEQYIKDKKVHIKDILLLCPARCALLLLGLLLSSVYHLFKNNPAFMKLLCNGFARPYHQIMARLTNAFSFSLAEMLYAALITCLMIYLPAQIVRLICRRQKGRGACKIIMTILSIVSFLYGGYCLLWGAFYAGGDFQREIGISAEPVSAEELYCAASYFADLANQYAPLTQRDENNCFNTDVKELFKGSDNLYEAVSSQYPSLSGAPVRAKPMVFSRVMSWINFTGFFFPFTGEANINTDAPLCLLPSTVAHELAHQRGVAPEDDANFAAVLACMHSEVVDYQYSGALLALIHLSNALHEADYEQWDVLHRTYSPYILADLHYNNEYWDRFDTTAADISETVYEGVMASYGDDRGMKSYGACVDLLVAYYRDRIAA